MKRCDGARNPARTPASTDERVNLLAAVDSLLLCLAANGHGRSQGGPIPSKKNITYKAKTTYYTAP